MSVELAKDWKVQILRFVIEDPKTIGRISCVSKGWNQAAIKTKETFLARLILICDKPDGMSEDEHTKSLYKFVFAEGIYYGRRGVYEILYFKDLMRFAEELKKGEGHQLKHNYSLCWHECNGYGPTMDRKDPIYLGKGSNTENNGDPNVAIAPLDYFQELGSHLSGAYGVPGPKDDMESVYFAVYDNRKKSNPNDPQLTNPCFGEFAFYDKNECTSSPEEKAQAIFALIAKKWNHN